MGERVGPADRLRSAALWVLNLSWFVPSTLAMTALYATVGSARVDGLTRAYCRAQLALLGNHYRHVVHPDALVERPMLFAANHVNHFDYITLYCATPHYKQGIELETHFRYPIYGRFMKLRGTIPVPEVTRCP